MINCPFCGTENPPDAKECHNCSADLSNLSQGNPPPESTAPTMMSSGAEVSAMLADAKAEKESEEPAADEPAPPPDYAAPTMMSSGAEVEAMLAGAKAGEVTEPEPSAGETPAGEPPFDEPETVEEILATPDFAAPTMISSSAEVAAILSDTQGEKEAESEPEVPSEPETGYAPTLMSIPDPLGSMESEEPPAPKEETRPEPKFQEIPTPLFNERVDVATLPTSSAPSPSTPETPPKKDNRLLYALAGCGCLSIACACAFALYFAFQYFQIR